LIKLVYKDRKDGGRELNVRETVNIRLRAERRAASVGKATRAITITRAILDAGLVDADLRDRAAERAAQLGWEWDAVSLETRLWRRVVDVMDCYARRGANGLYRITRSSDPDLYVWFPRE
jgi:hypothetical protein